MNADGSNQTNLTNNEAFDLRPDFSPDGKRMVFDSELGIHTINPNGTAPTVTNLQPSPNSTTRDKTPTIRATDTDLQTDLAKANVGLTVDGKAVAETKFSYYSSTNRLAFHPRGNSPQADTR